MSGGFLYVYLCDKKTILASDLLNIRTRRSRDAPHANINTTIKTTEL